MRVIRSLLLAGLILLIWPVAAQTGFFGLAYGDSYAQAKEKLTTPPLQGFEYARENDYSVFAFEDIPYIDRLLLYFSGSDSLDAWKIYCDQSQDSEVYSRMLDTAIVLHGEADSYSEEFFYLSWELGDGKKLYLGFNSDNWLVIEYYNPKSAMDTDFAWLEDY